MSVLEQGEAYIKKKINKIERMFASKQEGFSGILGPNAEMEFVNQTDRAKTTASVNNLNNNINRYQTATTALQNKTNEYLNTKTSTAGDEKRNYNVFINKSLGVKAYMPEVTMTTTTTTSTVNKINKTEGTALCVPESALADFDDGSDNGFDKAYPKNFLSFPAALEACQTWAADLGFKYFGVSKSGSKYKCYTSDKSPASIATNFTMTVPVYTVAANTDTTRGGLFANGQVGVYRSMKDAKWNINNMTPIIHLKHYNTSKYTDSEPRPYKNAVDWNWWGWSNQEFSVDPTSGWSPGMNKFPNDKTAWWIGRAIGDEKYKEGDWDEIYKAKEGGNNSYFYYVYQAPETGQDIGIYVVGLGDGIKINGVSMRLTKDKGPKSLWGFDGSHRLAPGKNVFEVNRPNGLPASGFVMYVYDIETNNILFRTGDPGWGISEKPTPEWNLVSNIPFTAQYLADPYLFATVNPEPNGFGICDKLVGGNINMKTINATYGKNCSTATKRPLKVRYILVLSNTKGDPIQISQLVVMAFLNGVQTNVANRGTITASASIGNFDNHIPVNGKTDNVLYWSSGQGPGNYWQLDLGTEYPLTTITFYNRNDYNHYANEMRIGFKDGKSAGISLKHPIKLTGQLVQTFNVSEDDIFIGSPNYTYAPPGYDTPAHSLGYGFASLDVAREVCTGKGQRICRKSELDLMDVCAYGWFEEDGGKAIDFPMAHGDPTLNGCGGQKPGTPGFKVWNTYTTSNTKAGVYCCDKDHTGAYNPEVTQVVMGERIDNWP